MAPTQEPSPTQLVSETINCPSCPQTDADGNSYFTINTDRLEQLHARFQNNPMLVAKTSDLPTNNVEDSTKIAEAQPETELRSKRRRTLNAITTGTEDVNRATAGAITARQDTQPAERSPAPAPNTAKAPTSKLVRFPSPTSLTARASATVRAATTPVTSEVKWLKEPLPPGIPSDYHLLHLGAVVPGRPTIPKTRLAGVSSTGTQNAGVQVSRSNHAGTTLVMSKAKRLEEPPPPGIPSDFRLVHLAPVVPGRPTTQRSTQGTSAAITSAPVVATPIAGRDVTTLLSAISATSSSLPSTASKTTAKLDDPLPDLASSVRFFPFIFLPVILLVAALLYYTVFPESFSTLLGLPSGGFVGTNKSRKAKKLGYDPLDTDDENDSRHEAVVDSASCATTSISPPLFAQSPHIAFNSPLDPDFRLHRRRCETLPHKRKQSLAPVKTLSPTEWQQRTQQRNRANTNEDYTINISPPSPDYIDPPMTSSILERMSRYGKLPADPHDLDIESGTSTPLLLHRNASLRAPKTASFLSNMASPLLERFKRTTDREPTPYPLLPMSRGDWTPALSALPTGASEAGYETAPESALGTGGSWGSIPIAMGYSYSHGEDVESNTGTPYTARTTFSDSSNSTWSVATPPGDAPGSPTRKERFEALGRGVLEKVDGFVDRVGERFGRVVRDEGGEEGLVLPVREGERRWGGEL